MEKETKFLTKIVKKASKLITQDLYIRAKGNDGDLVTNFDLDIENFLIKNFKKKYPHFDIISEEINTNNNLSDNCLIIDPIDGTVNFANNLPLWVIQVCMIKDGSPCCSVIYAPKLNELFYADKTGAYLNGEQIHVNSKSTKDGIFSIDGKSRISAISRMFNYTSHAKIIASAGMSFSFVSCGRFSGEIFRNDTLWDYMPGLYLVKQAGGYIIDKPEIHIGANTKEFAELLEKEASFRKDDNQKEHKKLQLKMANQNKIKQI